MTTEQTKESRPIQTSVYSVERFIKANRKSQADILKLIEKYEGNDDPISNPDVDTILKTLRDMLERELEYISV